MPLIRTTFLTAALSLGVLAFAPAPAAHAGGLGVDLLFGETGFRDDRGFRGERGFHRGDRGFRRDRCRPRRALRKARRLGLNRAYIHRAGPRGVVVRGRTRGERIAVRFGGRRGCPVRVVRRLNRY